MRKHEYGDRDILNLTNFATISSKTCYTDTRVVVYFVHAGSTVATSVVNTIEDILTKKQHQQKQQNKQKHKKLNKIERDRQELCHLN